MMTQDEIDTRDIEIILAKLPEDAARFPCEIEIAERDEQGRVKSITIISSEENHA
jgi:hypothetical protein